MLRTTALIAFCMVLTAEVYIEQPHRWWDSGTSHHNSHGQAGMPLGVAGWAVAWGLGAPGWGRVASGTGLGLVAGFGYEIQKDYDRVDIVDALWVGGGAFLTSGLCELGLRGVSILLTPDTTSFAYTYHF